jgi:hypothetical protein
VFAFAAGRPLAVDHFSEAHGSRDCAVIIVPVGGRETRGSQRELRQLRDERRRYFLMTSPCASTRYPAWAAAFQAASSSDRLRQLSQR